MLLKGVGKMSPVLRPALEVSVPVFCAIALQGDGRVSDVERLYTLPVLSGRATFPLLVDAVSLPCCTGARPALRWITQYLSIPPRDLFPRDQIPLDPGTEGTGTMSACGGPCAVARVPTHTTHPAQEGMCTCRNSSSVEIPMSRVDHTPMHRLRAATLPMLHGGIDPQARSTGRPVCRCHPWQRLCHTHPPGRHARCIQGPPKPTSERSSGPPEDRQSRGAQEAWQYCEHAGVVQDTFVVVWFVDGTVTGITTSKNAVGDIGFFCSSHRAINPVGTHAPTLRSDMRQR